MDISMDDVIYVLCLLACMAVGNYINKHMKADKIVYTIIGCLVVIVVSGFQSLHCFLSTFLGSLAAVYVHPRQCHVVTFAIMFGYLTFFRLAYWFGLPSPPGHTNMVQMILTLKVSGIAFEKTASWKKLQQKDQQLAEKAKGDSSAKDEPLTEISDFDVEIQNINLMDIFNYTFNYIGVLIGPYYRYRTYCDYFEYPFKDYAPKKAATLDYLKHAGLYCVLYLISNALWPLEYALSDEFYTQRSFFYRLMYVWPTFFIFRMRIYTGLTLSECVCTMAGFGAYPEECDTSNGEGPSIVNYSHLKRDADKRNYNFTTIVNTRVAFPGVETCWTFREGMRHWNVCVQYWLANNVYRIFPSKKYRTAATLLCSSYWHGFRPGHYLCLMGAPLYLLLEDIWDRLIRKNVHGTQRHIINVIFWIFKFFGYSYLATAFLIGSFSEIWKFYSSVYHIGYIWWVVMVALGVFITNRKHATERRKNRQNQSSSGGGDAVDSNKQKVQ